MRNWLSIGLVLVAAACDNSSGNGNNNPDLLGGGNNGGGNFSVVSRSSTVDVGSTDCPNGGVRVQIGLDDGSGTGAVARDGTLQDSEVDKTEFICNAAPTTFATLTLLTPLPIGDLDCPFGGSRVDYGLDNGDGGGTANNGTLEMSEIDGHTNACVPPPDNLLVITTPLFPGDPICPYGGQTITSGFDDGKPTGTANNGQLEIDEIDLTTTQCTPPPADTFPTPTGTAGTAYINTTGGTGQGSGSASGGGAGSIAVIAHGAQLATGVQIKKAGTVTAPVAPAQPAFTAGANPVVFTSTPADLVPVFTTKQATGAYIYRDLAALPGEYPKLYNGMNPATSLHIGSGAVVTFSENLDELNEVRFAIDGDVWIEGTFKAQDLGDGQYPVYLQSGNFLVDTTGVVDLRGDSSAHYFELWAVFGTAPTIYNKGRIDTSGLDEIVDSQSLTSSASMNLTAKSTISNSGKLWAKGSSSVDQNRSGSNVFVHTLKGSLFNSGEIDVSGKSGDGGSGAGSIYLLNADNYPDVGPGGHPVLNDPVEYGPGSFAGSGNLIAAGAGSDNYNNPGSGGEVVIRFVGGSVYNSGFINTTGGSNTSGFTSSSGGFGGNVSIGAFTWVGADGTATPVVPGGIFLGPPPGATMATQGSIDTRGGLSLYGGRGGDLNVFLDITNSAGLRVLSEPVRARPGSSWLYYRPFTLQQLDGLTTKPVIQLVGYGGNLTARGGASETYASNGGYVTISNSICPYNPSANVCRLPFIGERLIATDATIDVEGGAGGTYYAGGAGGQVNIDLDDDGNYGGEDGPRPTVSYQPTQLLIGGLVDASSPNNAQAIWYYSFEPSGGSIYVSSNTGQVDINGELRARGATLSASDDSNYFHGRGGYVSINGVLVDIRALIDTSGGGDATTMAYYGGISINGYRVTNQSTGTLKNVGRATEGGINVEGISSVINLGNILSNPTGYRISEGPTSEGLAGGYVTLDGATVVNNGTINVKGASFTTGDGSEGGNGGYVYVYGSSFSNAGLIEASGGDSTVAGSAFGGGGGGVEIDNAGGTTAGTVRVTGGKATSDNAQGGGGGWLNISNNTMGAISAAGGPAIGPAADGVGKIIGGGGGEVSIGGTNAGSVDAGGGDATGTGGTVQGGGGGYIEIDGANSACLDVSGGTGTTPGTTGTLSPSDVANFCS